MNTKSDQTENELHELTGRVSELEVLLKDKKKPWYKDTGLWISIVAVIFSIFTGLHDIAHQSAEELKAKRAEVLQNISDLIGTEIQQEDEAKKAKADPFDYHNDALDTKFSVLLSRIDVLNREIPDQLSPAEYSFIAQTYRTHGNDLDKALSYYRNSLKVTKSADDSFFTCEHMGIVYFAGSEDVRRVPEGDKYLLLARNCLHKNKWDVQNNKIDGYQLKQEVQIFGLLAEEHFKIGDSIIAHKYLDSSTFFLNSVPLTSDWRSEAVERYNEHIEEINDSLHTHLDTLRQ